MTTRTAPPPHTMLGRVATLDGAGCDTDEIAAQLRIKPQRVREYRWRARNYVHWLGLCRRRYSCSHDEHVGQLKAAADERRAPVDALLAQGLSWQQAANKLGLTKGQVAGLRHRAKRRKA